MKQKFELLGDRIVVRYEIPAEEQKTDSGIFLPKGVEDEDSINNKYQEVEVVKVGDGYTGRDTVRMGHIKEGATVLVGKSAGFSNKYKQDGYFYMLLRYEEIIAV